MQIKVNRKLQYFLWYNVQLTEEDSDILRMCPVWQSAGKGENRLMCLDYSLGYLTQGMISSRSFGHVE